MQDHTEWLKWMKDGIQIKVRKDSLKKQKKSL